MDLHSYPLSTREQWLARLAVGMSPKFKSVGAPLPEKLRVTLSLMPKRKAIGVCFDPSNSADGTTEVMVRIDRFDPVDVAAILAHELVHAAVGCAEGHGRAFKRVALAIGLEGKMRATIAGPGFAWIEPLLLAVGAFPHAPLNFNGLKSGPKTQKGRMLKAKCEECGYVVRVTRLWLEKIGPPLCPCNEEPMSADEPDVEEER